MLYYKKKKNTFQTTFFSFYKGKKDTLILSEPLYNVIHLTIIQSQGSKKRSFTIFFYFLIHF